MHAALSPVSVTWWCEFLMPAKIAPDNAQFWSHFKVAIPERSQNVVA